MPPDRLWGLPLALERHTDLLRKTIEHAKKTVESKAFDPGALIVGQHERLLAVFDIIAKVADTDSTVLITGESGTGKELIARALDITPHR